MKLHLDEIRDFVTTNGLSFTEGLLKLSSYEVDFKDNVVPPNQENNGNSNSAFVIDIMYTYNCNNKVTLSWNSINGADTYYVYRYNKKTCRISNPRVITGKTEYTYHKAVSGSTYYYLITTEQLTDRKLNTTDGIITIIIP